MTPETLARLTARSTNLSGAGRGKAELTPAEVAAALSGLSVDALRLALYRYVGDDSVRPALARQALLKVTDLFVDYQWRSHRKSPEMLAVRMTQLALRETLDRTPCRVCTGSRYVLKGAKTVECTWCHATGYRDLYDSDRARVLEMKPSAYRGTWKARYQVALQKIGAWLDGLDGEIWGRLRRE